MASTVSTIAVRAFTLYSPAITSEIFVVLTALFVFAVVAVAAFLTSYAVIVAMAARGHRYVPEDEYGLTPLSFNELAFLPYLGIFFTGFLAAFQQFFTSFSQTLTSAGSTAVSLIASNPIFFITIIVLSGFIALYLIEPQLMFPLRVGAWNGFLGPLIRTTLLPLLAMLAYLASLSQPVANYVSRLTKTATTSAILHSIVGALPAVVTAVMFLALALQSYALAQQAWVTQTTPPGVASQLLRVAPDFYEVGVELGSAFGALQPITAFACASAAPFLFDPLFNAFDGNEHFAVFVNETLALPYVLLTQPLLAPTAQFFYNLNADPGGSFAAHFSPPSFNSSIDTFRAALINAGYTADGIVTNYYAALVSLLSELTGFTLPVVTLPLRGFYSLMIVAPLDVIATAVKLVLNLVIALLTGSQGVYSYPAGIQLWLLDDFLAVLGSYLVETPNAYASAAESFIVELGASIAAEVSDPLAQTAISDTFNFVGTLIGLSPTPITTAITGTFQLVAFFENLAVGTVYTLIAEGIAGTTISPFRYAQQLYGDVLCADGTSDCIAPLFECKTVGGLTIFTAIVDTSSVCPVPAIAQQDCAIPIITSSGGVAPALPLPLGFTFNDFEGSVAATACAAAASPSAPACQTQLVVTSNGVTAPAVNQFVTTLRAFVQPVIAASELVSALCAGVGATDLCPINDFAVAATVNYLIALADLLANSIVHLEYVGTAPAYFLRSDCFPVVNAINIAQLLTQEATNAVRDVVRATVPGAGDASCPLANSQGIPNAANATNVACCALNIVDATIGAVTTLSAQVLSGVLTVVYDFLPASVGGAGMTSLPTSAVPVITTPTTWISVFADGVACIPLAAIPASTLCDNPSQMVHTILEGSIGDLLTQAITVVPNLLLTAIYGLIRIVETPSFGAVGTLLDEILGDVTTPVGFALIDVGNILYCADAGAAPDYSGNPLSIALFSIGTFIADALPSVLDDIVSLGIDILEFVVGFVDLITTGSTTVIDLAIDDLIVDAFKLIIAALGNEVCFLDAAICYFQHNPALGIPPFTQACIAANYDFTQVLAVDTCTNDAACFPVDANGNAQLGCQEDERRKRGVTLGDDCFDVVFTYGYENAQELAATTPTNDESAADGQVRACFAQVSSPAASFNYLAAQRMATKSAALWIVNITSHLGRRISTSAVATLASARDLHVAQAEGFASAVAGAPPTEPVAVSLDVVLVGLSCLLSGSGQRCATLAQFHAAGLQHQQRRAARKRSALDAPRSDSFVVSALALALHVRAIRPITINFRYAPALEKRSLPAPTPSPLAIAAPAIHTALSAHFQAASDRLTTSALAVQTHFAGSSGLAASARTQAMAAARALDAGAAAPSIRVLGGRGYSTLSEAYTTDAALLAPVAVSFNSSILPVLGLPICDPTMQIVCTNCFYADDLVLVSQLSVEAAKTFAQAPASEAGSLANLTAQLERTIAVNLIDPAGNDTYTTVPRTVPYVTELLWNVTFLWSWDYSHALSLFPADPGNCNLTNPLDSFDLDPTIKNVTDDLFGPLIALAQGAICRAVVAPAETAMALFQTYVVCDYDATLYGRSPLGIGQDGAQSLANGFINTLLIMALIGLAVDMIPGGGTMFMMLLPMALYFGTFWIGYMAPPTCTLPSIINGIPALPVRVWMDAYRVVEMTFPPGMPFPPGLLRPDQIAQFSQVLVTDPNNIPDPLPCTDITPVGFTSIYDNIFFSTASLLGDGFNQQAAATLGALNPSIAASALKFNATTLAELRANYNIGNDCNRLTFFKILFGLLGIALTVAEAVLSAITILFTIPFVGFIAVVLFAALFILNEFGTQTDRYYISDSRQDY